MVAGNVTPPADTVEAPVSMAVATSARRTSSVDASISPRRAFVSASKISGSQVVGASGGMGSSGAIHGCALERLDLRNDLGKIG